jgi:hypothetical protein
MSPRELSGVYPFRVPSPTVIQPLRIRIYPPGPVIDRHSTAIQAFRRPVPGVHRPPPTVPVRIHHHRPGYCRNMARPFSELPFLVRVSLPFFLPPSPLFPCFNGIIESTMERLPVCCRMTLRSGIVRKRCKETCKETC